MFDNVKLLWRGVFGACSDNLLSWEGGSAGLCCFSVVTVPAPLCSVFFGWHCSGDGFHVCVTPIHSQRYQSICVYSSPPLVISPSSSSTLFPIEVIKRIGKGRPEIRRVKPKMVPHSRHVPASSFCHWNAESSVSAIEHEISWARGITLSLAYISVPQYQCSINIHSWF